MKKIRILSILIAVIFFFTWVLPPVLAEEAGDKMAEIFKKDIKPPVDLLPVGVEVVDGFEPGKGAPIGSVKNTVGKVLVVHQGAKKAYVLQKGISLFTGDTLITGEESSLSSSLNDKSEFALAPYSKIVLDKSFYDPDKNARDSLLRLMFGKARFIVTMLGKKAQANYRVNTPTAVVGVRGSDFALSVVPVEALSVSWWDRIKKMSLIGTAHAAAGPTLATTVVTGKETAISFAGNVGPTQMLGPLNISQAIAGMAAIAPMAVSAAVVFGALSGVSAAAGGAAAGGAAAGGAAAGGAAGAVSATGVVAAGGIVAAGAVASGAVGGGDDEPAAPAGTSEFTPQTGTYTAVCTSSSGTCGYPTVGDTEIVTIESITVLGSTDVKVTYSYGDTFYFTKSAPNTWIRTFTNEPEGSGYRTGTETVVFTSDTTGIHHEQGTYTEGSYTCTYDADHAFTKTGP